MNIQFHRTNVRRRIVDDARSWAEHSLTLISGRTGATRAEAMSALSRSTAISPGTLENLSRDRLKRLAAEDYIALRSALITEIHRAIGALEAELKVLRARGAGDGAEAAALGEAEAAVDQARHLLARFRKSE